MQKVHVNLGERSYDILISKNLLSCAGEYIKQVCSGKKAMIISDTNVGPLYAEILKKSLIQSGYSVEEYIFPAGEQSKTLATLNDIYTAFSEAGITRSDFIIALGGGVVGDIVGFAAATWLRGVPYVQIPTSLLAQVDSSVGGKVAADLPQGKNLVGAFYEPKLVLIDTDVLNTLTDHFYTDGMGEVIKYGCVFDQAFFNALKEKKLSREEIISRCCTLKAEVVEKDERDIGERMLLNFGHTLGHAIEKAYQFSTFSHGQAVAIGMVAITRIAESKGLTKAGTADKIQKLLEAYDLPTQLPALNKTEVLDAIRLDKKNLNGGLNVILLNEIGSSYTYKTGTDFFDSL